MDNLSGKVAKGAIWATMEKTVTQAVQFVVGIVLARLLTPNDYGTVALLSIFFAIAGTFANCGFGNALVQRKEVSELQFNSVFWLSFVVSCGIYAIFFFSAPWIATFYNVPILKNIVRVSALSFIFSAINSVQSAELNRKMLFDRRFWISLITCTVSAVCGIVFAYMGWGVWALVLSSTMSSIARVLAYWMIIAWRPKLMFSFSSLKNLFSYGWKMSIAGMLNTIYVNLSGFIIGKFYTPADLAFVNKGKAIPNLLMSSIDGTITSVSFPALAQLQNDKERLRSGMRRMIMCSTYLVFPFLAGLCLCAKPLILLLYGEKWTMAVPYVMIACFAFALGPFNTINTMAISAMGRSDVFLLLNTIKKIVGIAVIVISLRYGVLTFMLAWAFFQGPFAVLVNTFANGRLLGYTLFMQVADIISSIIFTIAMSLTVLGTRLVIRPLLVSIPIHEVGWAAELMFSALVGISIYLLLSILFKPEPFQEYLKTIHPIIVKRIPGFAHIMEKLMK